MSLIQQSTPRTCETRGLDCSKQARLCANIFTPEPLNGRCDDEFQARSLGPLGNRILLAMTAQSSACNKLHSIEEQLSRWLLTMHDYVGEELLLTHDLIAQTLGVRRAGISVYAKKFKNAGLIDYRRAHIRVLDRHGLKEITCECYQLIRDEYDRLYADLAKYSNGVKTC